MICPTCRAENADDLDHCFRCGCGFFALTEGTVVASRYEILSPLGRGGMGHVYRAKDRELRELVALKVLRIEAARSAEMTRRFRHETKLARRVRHPNVCAFHDYGTDGHIQYLTMELVAGPNLRTVLKSQRALATDHAYDLAIQVAEGLQAIHEVGIVHRDVKPANVMIDGQGRARLTDFGMAKSLGADVTSDTASGQILGTPEYMSPEQARGKPVDARSDIYALGIVAYELFTGDVPFRADTPITTLLKQIAEPPPMDGPRAERIPEAARPVLARALEKEPADRFRSARDMAAALRDARSRMRSPTRLGLTVVGANAMAAVPVEVTPTPVPLARVTQEMPRPPLLRRPRYLVAGGAGAAALVVAVYAIATRPPEREPVAVVAQRSDPDPPPATAAPTAVAEASRRTRREQPRVPSTHASVAVDAMPTAAPPPTSVAPAADRGYLKLTVVPWAEVAIDGQAIGTSPFAAPLALSPGEHTVTFTNPGYVPRRKSVTITSGTVTSLEMDFPFEGFPK